MEFRLSKHGVQSLYMHIDQMFKNYSSISSSSCYCGCSCGGGGGGGGSGGGGCEVLGFV